MPDDLDLDDPEAPRSTALVAQGNAEVARRLHDEVFEADRQRLRAILEEDDKLFLCGKGGGHLYDFHQNAEHPRGLWRRIPDDLTPAPDAPWQTVFDLDAYCRETGQEWAWRGPVGRPDRGRAMMMLSLDGSDMLVGREFDLTARDFVPGGFETPLARQWVAWQGPDRLLVFAATHPRHATRSGWPRTVRAWTRGTALDDAPVIFEAGPDDVQAMASHLPGEGEGDGTLLLSTHHTIHSSTLAVEKNGRRVVLDLPRLAPKFANDRFVVWEPQEDGDHPAGATVLRRFDGPPLERVIFVPGPRSGTNQLLMTRDWLVMTGHDDLRPWLRVLDLRQPEGPLRDLPLPAEASTVWILWHAIEPDAEGARDMRLNIWAEGQLLPPSLYRIDLDTLAKAPQPHLVASSKPSFDASGMQAHLLQARSGDGTQVPYHLALPKAVAQGAVPVVVQAYGGYGMPMPAPYLKFDGPALLDRGIGVAVAHLRGGGEFGPSWHRQAMGPKRPTSFDDCVAVARDLVARGIAPPGGVGFVGGSNGGLLAAVMATRNPADWGAIKADVPVTDMLRFHLYPAGAAWIEEYGDPDIPEDAAYLRAYSPLHQVRPRAEVAYPPILIDAPAHDDRVDPAHARRFALKLQEAGQDVMLRTSETGGHGGGETSDRAATDIALTAAFFRRTLAGA
ncbi:S9 family peptidase (plasmid) [Paracoccus liaowanqingii]|uniref:S9 family peptidase n=1 Tax=Paracoccus liaowanqingii TaxID=2560053 RepID=A0A4Y5ST93_9RHOB|nr:prolyl oligopeptidase family serine peptidase [Paracoccus liaowanqingii]QDA36737.1 S9 family peptidase [Paracoccus liaowanqingii]